MSKNQNYDKHQRSRLKKFVATMPDGHTIQKDTEKELHDAINERRNKLGEKNVAVRKVEGPKQKFDPFTGEPL